MLTFRTTDGVELAYWLDDYSDPWLQSDTVVLLHPGMGSAARLAAWVPHLARDYRVVRPDLRGHGRSQWNRAEALTHERLARDVVELLDVLGTERAHLVGSSAGAIIAMQTALRFPERVASLGIFSAVPGLKADRIANAKWAERIAARGVRTLLEETIRDRLDVARAPAGKVKWFLDTCEGVTGEFLSRFVPVMASEDFSDRLAEIRCPSLIVVPGADPMYTLADYAPLKRIPHHQFVVYEGEHHSITADIPDRCAQEVRRFLAETRAQAAHR